MSESTTPRAMMTRRNFLKTTAAVGAVGLAGAGGMATTNGWFAPAEAHAESNERVGYLCHQFHCLPCCNLKCTVRDGRLALIEPNDAVEESDRRICLRGISEIQHVYAADRIQTPMKRVGERGEGKFVQISWDEAIKTIADAIKESQEKYGEDSFFFRKSTEAEEGQGFAFFPKLVHAHSGGRWGLDRGQANGFDAGLGRFAFSPKNSSSEWKKASTLVFLGDNILESGMTWSKYLFDAKEAGTKIITIDPRFSPTASKSHQWIPVKPGTDAAFILATTNVVLANNWVDEDFMKSYTGFPFLVDTATGALLGRTEEQLDASTKKTKQVKIPMVWDASSNTAKDFNAEGVAPELEGTWTYEGSEVSTAYTLTKKHYLEYTVDWASEICGIGADVIEGFARDYATNGPAFIAFGLGGPDKYTNADVLGHALLVLTGITGNIGREGRGTGWYGAGGAVHSADGLTSWKLPEEFGYAKNDMSMYDMPYEENNVHVALTFGDAFTLESGNANKMLDWVKSLDFFAICDIYHSSAVDYADIVLPACTKFECEEDVKSLRDVKGYLSLATKVIDPLFESKTDLQIERLLAAQWGLEDYLPKTYEELARFMLSKPKGNMEGFTYEKLLENQGVLKYQTDAPFPKAKTSWSTDTKRLEPYYEKQVAVGQALPTYETPNEAYEGNEAHKRFPLVFMQGKSRFRIHAYYSASSWLQEYFGPVVNISPNDAASRGIENGDDVRVSNDRGSFVARAAVNNAIMDGTLFMAETTYNHYYKEGFLQNVTNSARQQRCYDMLYGPQIPFNDTLVEIEKA